MLDGPKGEFVKSLERGFVRDVLLILRSIAGGVRLCGDHFALACFEPEGIDVIGAAKQLFICFIRDYKSLLRIFCKEGLSVIE